MKNETFIEWCNTIGIEETRIVSCDLVSMEILKECWDNQQKKIDEKDAKIKELEEDMELY